MLFQGLNVSQHQLLLGQMSFYPLLYYPLLLSLQKNFIKKKKDAGISQRKENKYLTINKNVMALSEVSGT